MKYINHIIFQGPNSKEPSKGKFFGIFKKQYPIKWKVHVIMYRK